jgi:uracil-DNA glycosylase
MKPLLIGIAPGKRWHAGDRPLAGRAASLFASLAGVTADEWLARVDTMNLLPTWPGRRPDGKGDHTPRQRAHRAAREAPVEGRVVVYVGREVARAFGHGDAPWFRIIPDEWAAEAYAMPHPSGLSRWWNSADNRRAAGAFLRSIIKETEEA